MAILNWHRQPRLHEARNRSERFGPETTLGLQCGVREIQARIQESGFISLWDIGHTWQDQRIIEPVSRQVRGGSGLLPSSLTLGAICHFSVQPPMIRTWLRPPRQRGERATKTDDERRRVGTHAGKNLSGISIEIAVIYENYDSKVTPQTVTPVL